MKKDTEMFEIIKFFDVPNLEKRDEAKHHRKVFLDNIHGIIKSKKISNDQELIQSDPISCPQNQKGNN